ncbi:N-acetylmuramoyl-L-alanine amidase [Agitococcus lubricus]|uniref:N-acetylmuramoyl-L-alanine amidase n=1 Tax=Agitococcus lubricus TaxID=1077255 RepID=A0A2T5IYL9_9GAMM|nr:N-acetylmuramoyl-L-alanine amidase [Agitococcus lubricus]PTQ89123.1 N-acetylmuramoyl-L-alanine amidase [Agitococcus lubricus]
MKLKFVIFIVFLMGWLNVSLAATITAVRSWRAPDNTRLVLDLSEKTRYRQLSINNKQLIIELENTDLAVSTMNLPSRVGLVDSILFEKNDKKQIITINLMAEVRPHIFELPANDKYSPRLVIDLYDKITIQAVSPPEPEELTTNNGRSVVVVVDAGHGGEDSGAIGANGNYEKHVTLSIAKKLVALLRSQTGFKAYLTRDDDYFIPLQERRKIARHRYKADIFVSIHADAALSPLARGASVFALSRKGANAATSRFAQALADRENKSDLIGGVDNSNIKDNQLTNILADMVVEGTMTHGLNMGSLILAEMGDLTKLHSKRVEQAGFAVLKEAGMISVLVETGFISNPEEEAKLINPAYQQQMASAVFNGIVKYVRKYPIPRSYFAWNKEQKGGKPSLAVMQAVAPTSVDTKASHNPAKLLDAPAHQIKQVDMLALMKEDKSATKTTPVQHLTTSVPEIKDNTAIEDKKKEQAITVKPMINPAEPKNTQAKTVVATLPSSLDEFMEGSVVQKSKSESKKVAPSPKENSKPTKHKVREGDTLSAIASRYQVSVSELKLWNNLKTDQAVLGTTLDLTAPEVSKKLSQVEAKTEKKIANVAIIEEKTLPKGKNEKTLADKADKADKAKQTASDSKAKVHKVKVGDSLSSIATKYGVSVNTLREFNQLKDDNVKLDSLLKIPTP